MKTGKISRIFLTFALFALLACAVAAVACKKGYQGEHEIPDLNANAVFDIKTDRLDFASGMEIDSVDIIVRCGCTLVDESGHEVKVTEEHLRSNTVKYEEFDLSSAGRDRSVKVAYKEAYAYIFYNVYDYTINFYLDGKNELWKSVRAEAELSDELELSVSFASDAYNYSTDAEARRTNEARANRFNGWYDDEDKLITGVRSLVRIQDRDVSYDLHAKFISEEERALLKLSYDGEKRVFSGINGKCETVNIPEGVTYVDMNAIFASGSAGFEIMNVPSTARFEFPLKKELNTIGLKSVKIDGGNTAYSSHAGAVYSKDYKTLYFMPASSMLTSFHDVVEVFAPYCCAYWQIETLVIPDSVTTLESFCFINSTLSDVSGLTKVQNVKSGVFYGTALSIDDDKAIYYKKGDGEYVLSLIFDKSIETYRVKEGTTEINGSAFADCKNLTLVDLGDKLTGIGDSAFSGCTSLESITFPATLKSLGSAVFYECKSLVTVEGFDKVSLQSKGRSSALTVPDRLFYGCEKLKNIKLPAGLSAIGTGAFQNCDALDTIEIPDTVSEIGSYAFGGSGLTEVVLPSSLTSLQNAAFSSCKLTQIDLSRCNKLSELGTRCFYECKLTSLTIPSWITSVGAYCFYHITTLERVDLGAVKSIGSYAFSHCDILKDIIWGEKLVSIGSRAFSYCGAIENIVLPDSVTTVTGLAFQACTGLKSITLGAGVKTFGNYTYEADSDVNFNTANGALYLCGGLKEIRVSSNNPNFRAIDGVLYGNSVCGVDYGECSVLYLVPASLGKKVQGGEAEYEDVETLTLPASVKIILPYAFEKQSSIKNTVLRDADGNATGKVEGLKLNDGLENIGKAAFYNSQSLEFLTLPVSLKYVGLNILLSSKIKELVIDESNSTLSTDGNVIYSGNTVIAYVGISGDVVIRDGVTEIASGAFMRSSVLKSVTLPDSVTAIGKRAFMGCSKLTSISIGAGLKDLGDSALAELSALKTITVSAGNKYFKTENGILYSRDGTKIHLCAANNGLKDLSSLRGVTEICEYAFSYHATLEAVRLPSGVRSIGNYAFYECRKAEYFFASETLEEIGDYAFAFGTAIKSGITGELRCCDTMKFILLYGNIKHIGNFAFYGHYGIEATYFKSSVEERDDIISKSGSNSAFFLYGCQDQEGNYYNKITRYMYLETEPDSTTVKLDGYEWFRFDENNMPKAW